MGCWKINDIFCGKGINKAVHIDDNMDGVDKTLMLMNEMDKGLIFTNLVEFDSKWGHRRDVDGYSRGLRILITDYLKLSVILEMMTCL